MKLCKWYMNEMASELYAAMKDALGCDSSALNDLPSLSDWLDDGKTLSDYLDISPLMPRGGVERQLVMDRMGRVLNEKVVDETALWDERDQDDRVLFDEDDEEDGSEAFCFDDED